MLFVSRVGFVVFIFDFTCRHPVQCTVSFFILYNECFSFLWIVYITLIRCNMFFIVSVT